MTPRPHNPAGLTAEQIGTAEGWRLLDEDEIRGRGRTEAIQFHLFGGAWDDVPVRGRLFTFTYRTKLTRAELAQLP